MVTEENKENAGRFGSNKIENDIRNEAVLEIVQDIIQRLNSTDLNKSSSVDLKALIKEHFDSALVTFSQICGSANSDQYGMYKGLLVAQLKSVFRNFCLDFQNSQSAKLSLAVQNFRSLVKGKMESGCKPRKLLEDTLDSIKAEILREINSVLFPERFVQLNNLLDEEALCFKSENNRRLLERQGTFDSVLPELLEQYGEYVEMGLPDEDLEATSEQKFESTFEKLLVKILKKLNEKMNFDNHEIKEMFESDLTKILQTQFSQKMNMAKVKKDKKLADAATIVSSSLESWSKIVSTIFEENSEDLVINALQEMETKTLLISITSQIHKALADPILAEQMLKDTREKMECIVQEIKLQRQTQVELFRNIWEAQANSIIAGFMDKFSECLELKVVPDTNEMQSLRKKLINDSIEEVDFSWMNGYGYRKYEDLCTEFRTNVEQLMFDRSIAIMEELSKILCDLSDYQQCVMNECLEKYNNKLAELSKGDMNNEILETAKRFGNDAIQQFQNNVCNDEQTCAAITTKITSELNENIFQKNDEFIKHVRDRKLIINAEISNIVVATAEDYRSLTNVLLVASNYGKDKIAQIHDNLKDQAHRNLLWKLKLGKYAVNYNEFSHDLEMKIEEIYKQTLLSIDAQHCEWKQQLEMCRQKANNFYIQQFTSLMGNVQCEEELQEIHIDLKKQTIEIYEESFPMHCYADKVFAERKLFSSSLENNLSNIIYEKWQQFNLDIDRSVKESVEGVLKKYEQQMQSALNPFDYSCTGMITASHKKYSAYALEELRNVAKPKNINEQTYFDLLDSRLQSTFECLLSENSRKKNDIETKVANDIRQMRNAIMRDIFRLNVLPETSETVSKYYERIKSTLHSYKITVKNGKELDDFAASTLEETLREVYEEWDKKEVDPNELQLCIYNAVDEYNKEMENRTLKTGKLFRASAIEVFHEQALATVLKEFRFKVRQTSSSIKKLNDAIDAALKKYQELNNIRAADYFDAAIGIDLGTTFSCVAIYTGGKIEMIPDQEHHSNTIPSYVFYETAKKAVVGHAAKDQSVIHPQETIFDSKRLIGRKFTDSEIQKDIAQWPFKVIPDPSLTRQNLPIIEVHEQTLHPEEVSGEVLRHLKLNAEKYLGRKVEDVVITVPAYFNEAQKRATKAAASFANINVLEIINEPTAAALAYCLSYTDGKSRNILVFDLGGGTFDVSVMTSEKCNLTVKAVCGNNHLGGEDFDANLVDFCIKKFQQETGLSISKNATNSLTETGTKDSKVFERLRRLRHKCEQAKINLSKIDKVRVIVDYIYDQNNLDVEITVQDFNNMNRHLFAECIKVVEQAVKESKLAKNEIDDVILVGGSSRIPEMQRMLTEFFDGKSLIMSINPDEVVAQGAAYRAAILSGSSKLKDINFLDVNPFSIGTDIIGGRFSIIIPKNTTLPTKRTETYYTTYDYQTEMDVTVYEGEDIIAKNNNRLGNFCLEGIPFKKKGEEPVDITIECNQEGLLNVTAVVRSNQSSGHITIHSNRGGLTEEDIRAIKARKNM